MSFLSLRTYRVCSSNKLPTRNLVCDRAERVLHVGRAEQVRTCRESFLSWRSERDTSAVRDLIDRRSGPSQPAKSRVNDKHTAAAAVPTARLQPVQGPVLVGASSNSHGGGGGGGTIPRPGAEAPRTSERGEPAPGSQASDIYASYAGPASVPAASSGVSGGAHSEDYREEEEIRRQSSRGTAAVGGRYGESGGWDGGWAVGGPEMGRNSEPVVRAKGAERGQISYGGGSGDESKAAASITGVAVGDRMPANARSDSAVQRSPVSSARAGAGAWTGGAFDFAAGGREGIGEEFELAEYYEYLRYVCGTRHIQKAGKAIRNLPSQEKDLWVQEWRVEAV